MNKKLVNVIQWLFLLVAAVIVLFPIYIAVINSLKTDGEMARSILALPKTLQFQNYIISVKKLDFIRTTFNTFFITGLAVSGIIISSAMAGYIISRSKTKLASVFQILFIASMLIPFHSIMISLTRTAMFFNVKGSLLGTVAIYIGLGVNMAIFLYVGFVGTIPIDLEEAAIIDGCGPFKVFLYVIFPLLKPITATIAILDALWIWNDFLLPLLMITDAKNYTLILSANKFFGKYEADWTSLLAGLLMTSAPLVVFYLFFQKHIVKGIVAGAVKG
ncbi:carbohydrate ABC transporter permease [Vallitalea maricola]|uniref:Carbohydrate ABC transporter permease n=1 Tax=Vallitalea maricola TaxID=3074433 RepID=A0ACB5UGA1_9FIRM|nr:carbohydrate ABC transporter permease [Vallitalea sp. AN17-2]